MIAVEQAHPNHVGLNAQLLSLEENYRAAGINWYIHNLLCHLPDADPELRYTAYVHEPRFSSRQGLQVRRPAWSTAGPMGRIAWEQLAAPLALRRDGIDLLHAMAFVAPAIAADSPMEVPGATTIDTKKAKELFDKEILFVDVRKNSDWDAGRIPGAEHIELKKVYSAETLGKAVGKDEPVVIYCNGASCLRSSAACAKAVTWGFKNVYYYRDGFPAWKSAGYPVE